jgi:putative phosphoesterase
MRIGLISDTHGLLRPEALAALAGSDRIVHAGDVGAPGVLDALRALAPLTVVRGNNDTGPWARALPATATLDAAGRRLLVLHDLKELAVDPAAAGIDVVVAGHSHRPLHRVEGGLHVVNPGSAGPRRFSLPVTVARLRLDDAGVAVEIVPLVPAADARAQRRPPRGRD